MSLKIKTFLPNIAFFICIFLSLIFFLFSFLINSNRLDIPFLGGVNADVRINIEAYNSDIKVLINNNRINKSPMGVKNSYSIYEWNNFPIYSIQIEADKNNAEKIKNIVLTVGDKLFYYTKDDIKSLKKSDNRYLLADNIKLLKSSKYINDRGMLTEFAVKFLSILYLPELYYIPLFLLSIAVLIFLANKEKININFNLFKNNAILWLIILGLILRLAGNDYAFWTDELYTASVAGNPDLPFMSVFSDPGNPPFFFILARFQRMIFGTNEAYLRLLPCAFSIASVYALYKFVLYTVNDKKIAIFSAFLLTVNLHSVFSAQEFRCYSLCALFAIVSAHLLFKIIKENNNRDYILYCMIAILMVNTHYFEILVLIGNFLFAIFKIKDKVKFFFINLISASLFLPYFIITALNKALLNPSFNQLSSPDIPFMIRTFIRYNLNCIVASILLIVFLILIIKKLREFIFNDSKIFSLYIYSIYSTLFLFVSTYLISLIRPIVREYYYISILPLIIIPFALLFFLPFKKKIFKYIFITLLLISILIIPSQFLDKKRTTLINFNSMFRYLSFDSVQYKNKKIGIALHDYIEYSDLYKNLLNDSEIKILYKYPPTPLEMTNVLNKSGADVIYMRFEYKSFFEMVKALSEFYTVSTIRTNKDVMIARLVKYGKN